MPRIELAQTLTTRVYRVAGAPPMPKPYSSAVILAPERVQVNFIGGRCTGVEVFGLRVKKDGTVGESGASAYFLATDDDLPDWLPRLLDFNYQPEG